MLRIGVCDDMPFHAAILTEEIANWQYERQITAQIITFSSGEELLWEIENSGDFCAVFLDICLSGISGIETAIKVKRQNSLISVVFVSLYETYYNEMHELGWPIQFLDKPIKKHRLYQHLDQIIKEYQDINKCFCFSYNHHYYHIDLHNVLYFTSDGRIATAILADGISYKMYCKLNDIQQTLDYHKNFFIRIHQSYLVNTTKIIEFHRKTVILYGEICLPVSRARKSAIIQLQMNLLTTNDKI